MHQISNLPLNSLRAFEATARTESLTAAADELHVTQGAVSRQIKSLEEHLGFSLFDRSRKRLELTPKGAALAVGLSDGFGLLLQAVRSTEEKSDELRIKVPPTVAVRWLIPRLHQFQSAHPSIDVNLTTSWHFYDPDREDFDAGLIYSHAKRPQKPRPSIRNDEILEEWMAPLCSPDYLAATPPLEHIDDLAKHTLLNCLCYGTYDDWSDWFRRQGSAHIRPQKMLMFDYLDIALHAAVSGQGIVLGDLRLAEADLNAGRLIQPLDVEPVRLGSYHLISPRRALEHPGLQTFRDWLHEEARQGAFIPLESRLESASNIR